MKIKFFILSALFYSSIILAQICGTIAEFPAERAINPLSICSPINYNKPNNGTYYIKVKFHFLRNDGGTSITPSSSNISSIISFLNSRFVSHGINIVSSGYDFIDSTTNYNVNLDGTQINNLVQLSYDDNSINIYVVKNCTNPFTTSHGSKIIGISQGDYLNQDGPIAHEIGHALYLKHTFWNSPCVELIAGTNCATCGDLVCDTPADNNSGTNNGYTPDMTNLMSYYSENNRDHFTLGQGLRMRNFIEYNRGEIRTNFTPYLQGCYASNFCVNDIVDYKIIGNTSNSTVLWTKSSNLQITEPTNSSITVKGLSQGTGWIKFEFNGISGTNNIYVGKATNLTATPYSNGYIINCSPAGYYQMDYVDLVTNQTGTTWMYTGSATSNGSNFFYYVSPPKSFKFRLKSFEGCQQSTDWITITPPQCPANNYPSNLIMYSQCGSGNTSPFSVCGAVVHWNNVTSSAGYQFEYLIYNLTGQSKSVTSSCSGNSFTFSDSVSSLGAGPWYVKFKVKSKCVNNSWSDYSPWSATYNW